MTLNELNQAIEEATQDFYAAETYYSETSAQFASESAHYGDAWAGAAEDVANGRHAVHETRAALEALRAARAALFQEAGRVPSSHFSFDLRVTY